MKNADARNALDPGVHGITKFFDITDEEFKRTYLNLHREQRSSALAAVTQHESALRGAAVKTQAASGSVDWTGTYTTPIKDQGACGR